MNKREQHPNLERKAKALLQELLQGHAEPEWYLPRVESLVEAYIKTEQDGSTVAQTSSSAFVVVLSDIYNVIRTANNNKSSTVWSAPVTFERSTTKYW